MKMALIANRQSTTEVIPGCPHTCIGGIKTNATPLYRERPLTKMTVGLALARSWLMWYSLFITKKINPVMQ